MLRLEASFSKWSANLLVIYTRYWGRDSNAKLGLSPTYLHRRPNFYT